MTSSGRLFDSFMPHGMCYQWRPDILWLNVLSDGVIALAYFTIPAVLIYFLKRKKSVPFPSITYMFSLFILACGVTHTLSIWTVWSGEYGIQGLAKSFTAAVSLATAIMLLPVMPKLLALRSPKELEETNAELETQIEQRKVSEYQSIKLQGELAHLSRVTTVGQMANGLAHELNQPLYAISASSDAAMTLAKKSDSLDPLLRECLEDIQNETQRAGEIIRALRQFVGKKTVNRAATDINDVVRQAVHLMAGDARGEKITVSLESGHVPEIDVDRVQIAQVLVNLIRNSVEAIAGDKNRNIANDESKVTIATDCTDRNITVTVRDTGPGIAAGADPFKTYESDKSDGMGVGLSISRDIIEAHGGTLFLDTTVESGACFKFNLPIDAN